MIIRQIGSIKNRLSTDGIHKFCGNIMKDELKNKNWRYERKFFISDLRSAEVEATVKLHPAMFKENYPERYVNNIYFDNIDYKNYFDNQMGIFRRYKIRMRWYGEVRDVIENPILEVKFKFNYLGTKLSYMLNSLDIGNGIKSEIIKQNLKQSQIPHPLLVELCNCDIKLLNRYKRKYFQTCDGAFRITIDTKMEYYKLNQNINNLLDKVIDLNNVILELKYDKAYDDIAGNITSHFPFRMTRSSKYMSGVGCFVY